MARKQSLLDDLSTLPWWFNLILAILSYFLLKVVVPSIETENPIFKGIAIALPSMAWVFSLLFCLAALASAFHSWQRGELFNNQTSLTSIQNLTWQQFEQYIGEAYRRKGYSVEETGLGGADGGVDLILRQEGKTLLVQCKNWKRRKVGVSVVREMFGLVKAQGATGGVLVTAGAFTKEAQKFAQDTGLELIDGQRLVRLVNSVREAPLKNDDALSNQPKDEKLCPKCGSAMVKRTARQGSNKGKQFWGCSRFPACRGIRS
ncbi:restriction endonuclease [Endozoicomonas sp. 8E]|uniref:restriction endonuclease n=1 Tax=Endozoicomonas sp. 8E TaxID=3035692 RepID=UPI0029393102|nr:restriction endonuclease [Endozoicomonas sp. 8E]WOG29898.1 restriction endonuclease [Endozoicomonas sp. 8E]